MPKTKLHTPDSTVAVISSDVVIDVNEESKREDNCDVGKTTCKSTLVSWFKPSNYSIRLSGAAKFSLLYDTLISILSVSKEINTLLSSGIPAMLIGGLTIVPSLIPFSPNLINIFYKINEPEISVQSESDKLDNIFEKLSSELSHSLAESKVEAGEQLKLKLIEMNNFTKKLLVNLRAYKEGNKSHSYDNFIDGTYLLIRAVGGALVILKACNEESDSDNAKIDEVNKWLSVVSNTAYLAYMFAHYIPKTNIFCFFRKSKASKEIKEDEKVIVKTSNEVLNHHPISSSTLTLFPPKNPAVQPSKVADELREPLLEGQVSETSLFLNS